MAKFVSRFGIVSDEVAGKKKAKKRISVIPCSGCGVPIEATPQNTHLDEKTRIVTVMCNSCITRYVRIPFGLKLEPERDSSEFLVTHNAFSPLYGCDHEWQPIKAIPGKSQCSLCGRFSDSEVQSA